MQMLDSKGDNQGGYNAPSNAPSQDSYSAPQQGQQPSYQKPQQRPEQSYQQPSYNKPAAQQSREMPSSNSVPVIDIDEDEIPF